MQMLCTTLLVIITTIFETSTSENEDEKPNFLLNSNSKVLNSKKNFLSILDGSEEDGWGGGTDSFERRHFAIVNSNQRLEEVLHSGTLQLIIFLYLGDKKWKNHLDSKNFLDFLNNYDEAAAHLSRYSIFLGLVNCSSEVTTDYCSPGKSGNFAHGFQRQQEKIGFPIETLFSVDSIIASTLHLSLLYSVPIIQSLTERKGLEEKHRFKKDIILSLHKSLGTREHRLLLEISEKYRKNFAFAITTYSSAIYGLPNGPSTEEISELDPLVFILHCSDGQTLPKDAKESEVPIGYETKAHVNGQDPCAVVSVYEGAFQYKDFDNFLSRFREPFWYDINPTILLLTSKTSNLFFNDSTLPKVVFIYNSNSEKRVFATVPTISKLLIGSVNVFTIHAENLTKEIQIFLKIRLSEIRTPAVLFFNGQNQETAVLNDFDDAVSWVREELKSLKIERGRGDNQDEIRAIHQLFDLEELKEDDEVAKEMVSEDNFTLTPPLKGHEDFEKVLEGHHSGVFAIAFYLPWDPVSNVLLQHLQETTKMTNAMGNRFLCYRVNCYDWTDMCDSMEINYYPVLKLWNPNRTSIIYNGPIEASQLVLTILLLECGDKPMNLSKAEFEFPFANIKNGNYCTALNAASSFTMGIFSSDEDASVFTAVTKLLYGYKLTGIHIDEESVKNKCLGSNIGCLVITKKDDLFQPQFVINEFLNDSKSLLKLIEFHTGNVFGPLHPSNAAVMNFEEDCKPVDTRWKNILVVLILESCASDGITGEFSNHIQKNVWNLISESASSARTDFCLNSLHEDLISSFLTEEPPLCKSSNGSNNLLSEEDRLYFRSVGFVAEQLSSPGLVFSYICSKDELGKELFNTYNLQQGQSHLVAIQKGEGQVFAFKNMSPSRNEIRQWLKSVLVGKATPKMLLPSEEWTPVLEGFDYLSYMEEDMIREAEEQLAYDMEVDIGAYNTKGNKPYARIRN